MPDSLREPEPTAPEAARDLPGSGGLQRARGEALVRMHARGGRTILADLGQQGSAKAFLPRAGGPPEIIFLNTAGGLTGADAICYSLDLGDDTRATATTQTAERAYAARSRTLAVNPATVDVALRVGRGAALDWLPQETILYDGAALHRKTRADLAPGAKLLMAEMLIFGRAAMGETVRRLDLRDRREVWRAGVPVIIDPFGLTDPALSPDANRPRHAILGGARAIATIILVCDGAEDAAGALREAAAGISGVRIEVSGWNGKSVLRLAAADGLPLRRAVAVLLGRLRQGAALPRVWQI